MSQDLAIDVRAALIRAGKNQSWLAKQLGISSPYLSDILHGRRRSEEQVQKIKKILNIKWGEYNGRSSKYWFIRSSIL